METIKNLKIVKEILDQNIPNHNIFILDLLRMSNPNNMKNYYIGDRIKDYIPPSVRDIKQNLGENIDEVETKKLFFATPIPIIVTGTF